MGEGGDGDFLPRPSDEWGYVDDDDDDEVYDDKVFDNDDDDDDNDDDNDLMGERSDGDFLPRPSDERCGTRGHVGIVNCTSEHVT